MKTLLKVLGVTLAFVPGAWAGPAAKITLESQGACNEFQPPPAQGQMSFNIPVRVDIPSGYNLQSLGLIFEWSTELEYVGYYEGDDILDGSVIVDTGDLVIDPVCTGTGDIWSLFLIWPLDEGPDGNNNEIVILRFRTIWPYPEFGCYGVKVTCQASPGFSMFVEEPDPPHDGIVYEYGSPDFTIENAFVKVLDNDCNAEECGSGDWSSCPHCPFELVPPKPGLERTWGATKQLFR